VEGLLCARKFGYFIELPNSHVVILMVRNRHGVGVVQKVHIFFNLIGKLEINILIVKLTNMQMSKLIT
jgi:hypothetical protein